MSVSFNAVLPITVSLRKTSGYAVLPPHTQDLQVTRATCCCLSKTSTLQARYLVSNQCVGVKLGYSATKGNLGNFSLDVIEGMPIALSNLEYNAQFYSAGIFHRAYLGLTHSGQLGLFNETNLSFRSGVSHFIRGNEDGSSTDTKTLSNEIILGLSPGISVFIMDNVSASVSVGILGLSYKHNKQYVEDVMTGEFISSGANFQINILNINIGITVHI